GDIRNLPIPLRRKRQMGIRDSTMTKDSTKKDKNEEEDISFSPQKEVKGKPKPADYKKAD
ncbi:hypothetical protein, partial [Weissella confusa]|uniref:hypothetical protein n=1 Tax=Weissella confusa TaxID=1583 RepID=UPI001AEBEBFF